MSRRSLAYRFRSTIAAAVAVAFLPASTWAAEPTAYFPDGTMLVLSLNAQQFLQSPLIHEGAALKPVFRDAVRALDGFGVDPTKDADRVVLAIGEQMRAGSMLVLLHGRFDADKVQRRLKERGKERKGDIEVIEEGGANIFQCRLPPPPANAKVALPNHFYLTVLDGSTIALGIDRAAVAEALSKRAGGRKADIKPRMVNLVGHIDPKETLSIVFVPPANLVAGGPSSGLTIVTGGVTISDSITTDIRLDAKDADAAKLLGDNVRDGLAKIRDILPGLAALQLGLDRKEQDAIGGLLKSFKVTTRADRVVIGGIISKEMIERIEK